MEQTDAAYLAAYLDADGFISAARHKAGSGHYAVHVGFVSVNRDHLEWIKSLTGGAIHKCGGSRLQTWTLRVATANLDALLPVLFSHLRLKRRQAELALELRRTMTNGRRKIPPEIVARRAAIAEEIKMLNRLG